MDRYAVVGNPIGHSKSPRIHALFARQTGESLTYEAMLAPLDDFAGTVREFRDAGGRGLNVTVPFKQEAYAFVDARSDRATLARAVNTIVFATDRASFGDNTDGIGLVRDLRGNHGVEIRGRRILLLGAGGAVRGVLGPLIDERPERLHIANRTAQRAIELADELAAIGPVSGSGLTALRGQAFDLIINATSASLQGEVPPIPENVLAPGGCCYDMFYTDAPTAFVRWGIAHGASESLDGLGMLVEQAAESFLIWRGKMPDTAAVIATLRDELASLA
jgi:shikimate dehydrogenase